MRKDKHIQSVWIKEHYHCYNCEKDYDDDWEAAEECCKDANVLVGEQDG